MLDNAFESCTYFESCISVSMHLALYFPKEVV